MEIKKELDMGVIENDSTLLDDDGKPKRTGLVFNFYSLYKFIWSN